MKGLIKIESTFDISNIVNINHLKRIDSDFTDLCPKKQTHNIGSRIMESFLVDLTHYKKIEFNKINAPLGFKNKTEMVELGKISYRENI